MREALLDRHGDWGGFDRDRLWRTKRYGPGVSRAVSTACQRIACAPVAIAIAIRLSNSVAVSQPQPDDPPADLHGDSLGSV
jgi:hypothetical protein